MKTVKRIIFILMLFSPGVGYTDEAGIEQARKSAMQLFPGEPSYKVVQTPVPGLYEVDFGGGFAYITSDGRYAVKGEIIDVLNNFSLTEQKRSVNRLRIINKVSSDDMLVFTPQNGNFAYTISVFTDIDCSYCRRMHRSIEDYLKRGIRVRYLFYPRAGKGSVSYKKAVSVWCSKDRQSAMTQAKQGRPIPAKNCENPVDKHMQVADELGVTGTPTIILEDGGRLRGYAPASEVLYELKRRKLAAKAAQE